MKPLSNTNNKAAGLRGRSGFACWLAGLLLLPLSVLANNAVPVVNTTISVIKTGSEPFDTDTWDGVDLNTAGLDEDENNDVVRLQDTITYQVEVSVNDNDVDNLTSTVTTDSRQAWVEMPAGCETDPDEVNPVSTISADRLTLFCNLGAAIEGTTRVFYPVARVLGVSKDGTLVTLNDHHVNASVTAQADGTSNTATAGPTDTTVTANFKVETTKELKVTAIDSDTGEQLYSAPAKQNAAGTENGSVIEYVIKVRYLPGSMIADAPDEANGDYEIDFVLLDHYTDDNPNNNNNGALSTGAVLYDWDASHPACKLVGDHGPNASVSCTQINYALDQLSTTLGSNDGVNDPNIEINLQNIDVRDPDGDANLVEVQLSIWHSEPQDIATSDNCGPPCQIFTVNSVGVYDATGGPGGTPTVIGYNPVSTEDASNNNLPNFNGAGESHPDYVTYPLLYTTPGSWSSRKSFFGANSEAAATGKPTLTRSYAAGDTIPFLLNTWDYRFLDGAQSQVCDKIDTNNFEYVGLAQPNRDDMGYSWNHTQYNPAIISYQGAGGSIFNDGSEWTKFLYSDEPNATLTELRADLCNDDVNGDGFYVIDGIDQASSTATTEPNDWVTDPASLPGGAASVSKIRMETTLSKSAMAEIDPTSTKQGFTSNHLLKIKEDAVGYPNADGKTYLTNMSTSRIHSGDGVWDPWYDTTSGTYEVSIDSNDAGFGYEFYYADRVILVSSSMTIAKYTEPRGLKVVRGGDLVDFIIEPQVLGSWSPAITTATVDDDLPWQTDFVLGSSRFSVDGGNTWLDYDQYQASNPAVTLTSVANGASHDLTWEFDDLQSGEQLPLIRYTVKVRAGLSSGDFYNTATLNSQIGVDETGGPDPDDTGPLRFSGDGIGDPKSATYQLSIYPDFGLDVLKSRSKPVYETNTTMVFDLQYKNLGGENYSGGDFIDILPFNNDGDGRISSGLDSTRRPGSRFNGTYAVSNISVSNSEVVYATDRAYADIEQDPCHESNQPIGYIPVAGDICHNMYVNNGNQFAGGSSSGNGDTIWTACTDLSAVTCGALSPDAITALRFEVPAIAKEDAGQSIRLELTPLGNVGGTPALGADGNVLAASTGDIYTNNFGGRVPELSLLVISNDVSVTVVSGSIGNYVWRDNNGDTVQDGDEPGLPGVTMELLDGNGDPVYVDSVTGGVVTAATVGAVPYRVDTDTDGLYTFNNLSRSTYSVRVVESTLPAGLIQTFDNSGALDNSSTKTLTRLTDALGVITGVENNTDQDFGYRPAVIDLSVQKTIDKNSVLRGETIVYTITVRNDGADTATGVEVVDALPAGISYMSHNFVETYGDGLWEVGSLAPGEVRVLEITAKVD